MRIAVLGGLNLDLLAKPEGNLKLHDSNPGHIRFACGGVGHNAAASLMRLGYSVRLFTATGTGAASQLLHALCAAEGLPIEAVSVSEGNGCTYLCLHEDSGEMLCAVNDMRAMDAITPEKALSALSAFSPEALVLDTNLPQDTLTAAAKAFAESIPVFLDPVSTFKASRSLNALPYLTAIKPNRMEALDMTGERSVEKAAERLIREGVRYVFISLGAEGVYYADRFRHGIVPALPVDDEVSVTGAGDAMFAGLIDGILRGMDVETSAQNGCRAAWRQLTNSEG